MHSLYMEFCYVDELPYKERELLRLFGKFFDEHYEYWLARPSSRQVALRCPLGGDAKAEYGDTPRDIRRQNRVPAILPRGDSSWQPELMARIISQKPEAKQ